MNDNDFTHLQAQINAIHVANEVATRMQRELAKIMEKLANTCGFCGLEDTNLWVATTCPDEHVMTTRVCKQCSANRGMTMCSLCIKCQKPTLDWAVKADRNHYWSQSWEDK